MSNGECNDGGPGSEYNPSGCAYGADCQDCGPRPSTTLKLCSNETMAGEFCKSESSAACADGHMMSFDTSSNNCGTGGSVYYVAYSTISPPPSPPPTPPPLLPKPPEPPSLPPSPPPLAPPLADCSGGQSCGVCFMRAHAGDCPTLCDDTCSYSSSSPGYYASDGSCQDGGPGAEYSNSYSYASSTCKLGTDCTGASHSQPRAVAARRRDAACCSL